VLAIDITAGPEIPQTDRVVTRAGEGTATVGERRHRIDWTLMTFEGSDGFARFEIPEPQRPIPGAGEGTETTSRIWTLPSREPATTTSSRVTAIQFIAASAV
jgi:hypothetical protein